MDPRVAVVDRQHDGCDPHVGERGIGHVIAQESAQFFEDETLNAFVPVTGTFFFSSHDKRLPKRRRTPRKTTSRSASAGGVTGPFEDDEVRDLMARCRGFILPGSEDFGISAVEAQAAGRPVIAFGAGGALESIIPGETGLFFPERTAESLMTAIRLFDRIDWNADRARANAERFSKHRFQREIMEEIRAVLLQKQALKETA